MTMPGRKYAATGEYRYGFNGKENDKDVSEGIQDYGMRIYDARIGKFLSVDPLTDEYPELTPYQYASNTPIQAIDIDGLEACKINLVTGEKIELGPVSNDAIKRIEESGLWKVFFYPISRPKEQTKTSVSPKPPVYKPKIATGSDSFASDAVSNAAKINSPKKAKKKTTPINKQATVSEYTDYKKSLSRLYERQYAFENNMKGATMDAFAGSVVVTGGVAVNGWANNVADNALGAYEGFRDGEYGKGAGYSLLWGLDIAPFALKGVGAIKGAAKGGETILEGAVKSNYSRFVRKIPANSKASASFELLEDGNYLFKATSPGKVPGSSALYQKWVNAQGETFKMLKTTFAPDGSIVDIKPKM